MGLLTAFIFYENRDVSIIVDGEVEKGKDCTVLMTNSEYGEEACLRHLMPTLPMVFLMYRC